MATAIIGAGIAGLSAARRLVAEGEAVHLFDKGRGPGGRLSTRRAETSMGELRWDHGAQFFTARSDAFSEELVRLRDQGAVAQWQPRLADVRRGAEGWTLGVRPSGHGRGSLFVGTPAMNTVIKAMAAGLTIDWERRVTAINRDGQASLLEFEDGKTAGPFDTVICAIPAEQAAMLLAGASPCLADEAAKARSAPCWAVMLAFDTPVRAGWDGANVSGGALSWVARNASKPGRSPGDTWVLHASPGWSAANIDLDAEAVADCLVTEFCGITNAQAPVHSAAHRWLYAKVETPSGSRFGWDAENRIAAIGDWRSGPRVEEAWLSGHACAGFLTGSKQLEI